MQDKRVRLALVLLMLGVLTISGCSHSIKVVSISEDMIADCAKNDATSYKVLGKPPLSITWRANEEMKDYQFFACDLTYEGDSPGSQHDAYYVAAFRDSEPVFSAVRDRPVNIQFAGMVSSSMPLVDGQLTYELQAFGTAYDSRIVKVHAETIEGKTFETTPVNGYW